MLVASESTKNTADDAEEATRACPHTSSFALIVVVPTPTVELLVVAGGGGGGGGVNQ